MSFALSASEFKVVTLNVYRKPELGGFYGSERMQKICEVLKDKDHPHNGAWDIVLIQEAWTVGSRKALKNCGYSHIVDIGSTRWNVGTGMRHRRGGIRPRPRPGRHGRELNFESGLLILSKFPIKKSLRYEFKNEGRLLRVFSDGESLAAKSVYLVHVDLPDGKKVWVANTHLVANYCDNSDDDDCESYEKVRLAQMIEMKKVFNEWVGDDPVIFGGDINAGEHPNAIDLSWVMLPNIFPGFRQAPHDELNVSTSSPLNFFKSGHKEGGKLDHIFASPHFEITDGKLAFEETFESSDGKQINYSDHFGWESVLQLK